VGDLGATGEVLFPADDVAGGSDGGRGAVGCTWADESTTAKKQSRYRVAVRQSIRSPARYIGMRKTNASDVAGFHGLLTEFVTAALTCYLLFDRRQAGER
jgi:hypothetical protein